METTKLKMITVDIPYHELAEALSDFCISRGLTVTPNVKESKFVYYLSGSLIATSKDEAHNIMNLYSSSNVFSTSAMTLLEFMDYIDKTYKLDAVKLNSELAAHVSNLGKTVKYIYRGSEITVSDDELEVLRNFFYKTPKISFQHGEYCEFPNSDIRHVFASLAESSGVKCSNIVYAESKETVLFFEGSAKAIFLKKDANAYLKCNPSAVRLTMEEFGERTYKLETKFMHMKITKDETSVSIGCQKIMMSDLNILFGVIDMQKGLK